MKKLVILLALVLVSCVSNAYALIEVGDCGETGWQTYTYTASKAFAYYGFLVTDAVDTAGPSQLLVDNVKKNGTFIEGFEGDMPGTGYGNAETVTSYTRLISPSTLYMPKQGSKMALLISDGSGYNTPVNTSAFGYGATDGTYGYIPIELADKDTLTFDWAFMTEDHMPFNDYCMFFLINDITGVTEQNIMLANIGHSAIPEPASLSLLGLGLLGLLGLKKRKA